VVCPQKLDERNQRVKTDGRDAKALCQKLDRYVEGNRDALAVVRVCPLRLPLWCRDQNFIAAMYCFPQTLSLNST
jgi:hypothetical protein